MKLLQNQEKELTKLDKAKEDALHTKTLFDGLSMDIEKSMTLSSNEIVQSNQTLENSFLQLKINEVLGKKYDTEAKIILHDKPQSITQLKFEDPGKLLTEPLAIKPPVKITEVKNQLPSIIKEMKEQVLIPETKLLRTIDTQLEDWTKTKMCVSKDGRMVLSGKIKDDNWLKCFNVNGDRLWQIKMGTVDNCVNGLASSTNNEHFFLVMSRSIEMRNFSDGQKKYKYETYFSCGHSFCPADDVLLVGDLDSTPRKLVKLNGKWESGKSLEVLDGVVETNSVQFNPFGYSMLNNKNKQLLIVTSWEKSTIKAIDYSTGNTEWSITGEYKGKEIEPHGVSHDDFGNLYIADGRNKRVILVSPEGSIKRKLIDTASSVHWVDFIEAHRLVVQLFTDNQNVQVYLINYKNVLYPDS